MDPMDRLDRILMNHTLAEWAEAIRYELLSGSYETACDQSGLDAIHDRLEEIRNALEHIQKTRQWKVTLSRAGLVIEIGPTRR